MSNTDDVNFAMQDVADEIALLDNDLNSAKESLITLLDNRDAVIADLTTKLAGANGTITTLQATCDDLRAKLAAALSAATTPPPPPPPPPSGFSVTLQGMVEISTGVYRSNNLGASKAAGGQVAVVQARLNKAAQPGQTIVTKYNQTTNVVPTGKSNIKDWRVWPSPANPYPNHWTGCGIGDNGNKITAENVNLAVIQRSSHPAGWTNGYFPFFIKADVKQHIERTVRLSSATGKGDGYIKIVVDGVTVFESEGFIVDGPAEDFGPQMVYAPNAGDGGPFPAGAYLQIENLSVAVI